MSRSDTAPAEDFRLRDFIRCCQPHFTAALIFSALVNILYLAPTLYMLQVYDRVVQSSSSTTLLLLTLVLAASLGLTVLLDRLRQRLLMLASLRIDRLYSGRVLRAGLFSFGGSKRISPLMREFETLRTILTGPAVLALFDTPWIVIYLAALFMVHWSMGLFALLASAVLLSLALVSERMSYGAVAAAGRAQAEGGSNLDALDRRLGTARALGMGQTFVRQLEQTRARMAEPQLAAAGADVGLSGVIKFLRLFFQSAALGLGAWLVIHKLVGPSAIFAGSMLMSRALAPIDQTSAQWRSLKAAAASWRALRPILAVREVFQRMDIPLSPSPRLEISELSIASPARDRLILQNINLKGGGIAGAIIGVIGPSGAGKSVLLDCLANVRAPDRGDIKLDGARLSDWDPDLLGAQIGYASQHAQLFAGTVKQNIARFGALDDLTSLDQQVIQAAQSVGAHDMILSLPNGYDTLIEDGGAHLSSGQAQLIALSRAFFGEPRFMVLDEPNAFLDGDGEKQLLLALRERRRQGALIVLAGHRLPLNQIADVLMVIREGRLLLVGPTPKVLEALSPEAAARPEFRQSGAA